MLAALMLPLFDNAAFSLSEDIGQAVTDTGLPVVCIDVNDGSGITDRETYKEATMYIQLNDMYAEYTNDYTEPGGAGLVIKGRGNSTWTQFRTQKRPYTIKLDKKVEMFGMRKSKKYTLLANYMDRSDLRNKLAYDLSGALGLAYCQSVFVNLYLNGNYLGVYQFCERPDVDEEIYDWGDIAEDAAAGIRKSTGMSKDDRDLMIEQMKADVSWITSDKVTFKGVEYKISDYYDYSSYSWMGGYLIEYDYYYDEVSKFKTDTGVPLNIRNPENLYTNDTLTNYLQGLFADFEEAIYSESFYNSKGHHYSEYIDVDSFVDYYIVNALFLNVEFGYKSMYLYIDGTGLITMGPVWDFDWSSGNRFLGANGDYNQWYNDWRGNCNTWYRQLYGDPWFVSLIEERWFEVQDEINAAINSIDYYYGLLNIAATYEINVYKNLSGEGDFRSHYGGYTFKQECDQLRAFLKNRQSWMSGKLTASNPDIEGYGANLDTRMNLTLSGSGISAGSGSRLISNYTYVGSPENEIKFSFSLNSAAGVTNTFEIYVNGIYFDKFTAQNATLNIPCSLFYDGINVITAVRVREGVYYGTCNFITLRVNIVGRMVDAAVYKISPGELTEVKDRVTVVSSGSVWKYYVTTRGNFDSVNSSSWTSLNYNDNRWNSHASPLGDRLSNAAAEIGWTGNNHALFVRQKFYFDKSLLDGDTEYYMYVYYDNTFHLYLNGSEIFADDTAISGKNDWTDSYVTIKLSDLSDKLVNGQNIIAASLNDSAGGREFDLSLYAVNKGENDYVNPTASLTPEETALRGVDLSFFTTLRASAREAGMLDMLVLVNVKQSTLEKSENLTLDIRLGTGSQSIMRTVSLQNMAEYSEINTTYAKIVPGAGYTILGYVLYAIPSDWTALELSIKDGATVISFTSVTNASVMQFY